MTFDAFLQCLRQTAAGQAPGIYTHALDLSFLSNKTFYVEIPDDWLALVFHKLPFLRALQVAKTPFFAFSPISRAQTHVWLRLLDAACCPHLTSGAAYSIVEHLPSLYYLDLSWTLGLGSFATRTVIAKARGLRILRVRGCGLDDVGISSLLGGGRPGRNKLRSLDIRDNFITDIGADEISIGGAGSRMTLPDYPPPYRRYNRPSKACPLIREPRKWEDFFESRFQTRKAQRQSPVVDSVEKIKLLLKDPKYSSHDDPQGDADPVLSHLYISGTCITVHGAAYLLGRLRLQVLECGSLVLSLALRELAHRHWRDFAQDFRVEQALATSILLGILEECPSLTGLKVSHEIVTGCQNNGRGTVTGPQTNQPAASSLQVPDKIERSLRESIARLQVTSASNGRQAELRKILSFPASLMSLDELVLTSLPTHSTDETISGSLIAFMEACGQMEDASAEAQRQRGFGDIGHRAIRREPHIPLVLSMLVLEFRHDNATPPPEAEARTLLDEASKGDFSFFPRENRPFLSLPGPSRAQVSAGQGEVASNAQVIDVVHEISNYRQSQAQAARNPFPTAARWRGNVAVVR